MTVRIGFDPTQCACAHNMSNWHIQWLIDQPKRKAEIPDLSGWAMPKISYLSSAISICMRVEVEFSLVKRIGWFISGPLLRMIGYGFTMQNIHM